MKNINKTFKYMAMTAVALPMSLSLLTSCSEDENEEFLGRNEVKFTTAISGAIESRANVDYAPSEGNLTLYFDALGSTQHATYAHASDGWTCTSTHPLYWENLGKQTGYTFYAVAPSAEYGKVFADQSNDGDFVASDLLVARTTVDKANTPVNLVLKHLMGKLKVNVRTTEGDNALTADELATTAVDISGLKTAYTVETGTTADVPAVATVSGDVSSHLMPNKVGGTYSFIAPPQSTAGMELSFTVTVSGQERIYKYKVSATDAPALAAGTITAFDITISKTEMVLAGVTVTDWATGTTASATVGLEVVAQDGNDAGIGTIELWKGSSDTKSVYTWNTENKEWSTDAPFYVNNIAATDLFFARHTPEAANAVTGVKDVLGNTVGVAIRDGGVDLTLEHLMTKLDIALVKGENFPDEVSIDGATISLGGILPDAELTDANVATATGEAQTYTLSPAAGYLFVPQTIAGGTEVVVSLKNGNQYQATLPEAVVMKQGTANQLTLTLGPAELAIAVSVKDWTTGANVTEQALNISVKAEDGNAANVTTLTMWNTKDEGAADFTYDAAEGWITSTPYHIENYAVTDLFFARHTPEAADAVTGVKDVLGNTVGVAISDGGVDFTLEHLMTKLDIALVKGKNFPDEVSLDGATISLGGILPDAELTDANVATATGEAQTYTLSPAAGYLFVPQTIAGGTEVVVSLKNGNQYQATLPEAVVMKQGTANQLTLTLGPAELAIAVSVKDWTTGANVTEQALNISVKAEDGNAANVTTLTMWNTKDEGAADFTYDAAEGWITSTPYHIENYAATDLFFARHTPEAADAVTGVKDVLGNTVGVAISDGGVDLTLEHLMAKLTVLLARSEGFPENIALDGASIKLPGMKPTAELTAENVSTAIGEVKDYTLAPATDYLFVPQTIAAGTEIIVSLKNGNQYKATTSAAIDLKQGTASKITLTLDWTTASIAVGVKDWATGEAAAATLKIDITGTADTSTGDDPVFNSMILWLADKVLADFSSANSGTPLGTSFGYTKGTDGVWTSENPIYLDQMTTASVIYATATNTDAEGNAVKDAVTGYNDVLVAGAVSMKGGTVSIQFRHALAQLTVKIEKGDGFPADIADAVITTPALIKSASMNTDSEGYLYLVASGTETVSYDFTSESAHLVVPQTLAAGTTFTVKLKNGNIYTAKVAKDVVLEAGKNTTITLTMEETQVAVKAALTPWGEAYAAEAVHLADVTSGGNAWTPEEEGELNLAYVGATPYAAQYTYAAGKWNSAAPLYWDEIKMDDYVKDAFAAIFTPDNQPALFEKDILMGRGTTAAWGQDIALALNHVMAKFTVQIVGGVGIDDLDEEITGREIALQKSLSVEMGSDYKPLIGVDTDITKSSFKDVDHFFVAPQTLTDAHVITLTRSNGNNYTVKLSNLKDKADAGKALFDGGRIVGGNHYVITLNVTETAVTATATLAGWEEKVASGDASFAPIQIGAITGAVEGDNLTLNLLGKDNTVVVTATYTYGTDGWSCYSPIYWNSIMNDETYSGTFTALYEAGDGSWSTGKAVNVAHGAAPSFANLTHAMAKMTIQLVKGSGIENVDDEVTGRTVALKKNTAAAGVTAEGTPVAITLGNMESIEFANGETFVVAPQALTDAHVVTLTRPNGNQYTVKLATLMNGTDKLFGSNGIEAGKHYAITLTVNETGVGITAEIADWTDVSGSGDMKPEF